ncbi:MFS transporter [Amycolatopsis sp. FDAARGOS 1241]|uniref:MFS transporter n=1 Tax=Amycolatopsis sp. FDAARGOS 1241 TaxID=2778070 RepID=UPI00194EB60A|nr:MFS transporter [Amycolatopsis sp. FDAARGOS 1241]QRP49795.1 MFS transporter [Amycolatopsis sp. FDAARGOS 1241]
MAAKQGERPALGREFAKVWAASSVSVLGDGVRVAVLPLLAATVAPTPGAVSAVAVAGSVPWVLFSLFGGALADRHDRRRLMWRTDAARAALVAAVAAWVFVSPPPVWVLAALTFVVGCAETVFDNAATALLPDVVAGEGLDAANGRLQGSQVVGLQLLGPPLGAALFAAAAGAPLVVDAVSFALAALLVRSVRAGPGALRPRTTSMRADIAEGGRWLWGHHGLRLLACELAVAALAVQLATSVLVLLVVQTLRAPEFGYGLVLAAGAVGGLVGSVAAGPLKARLGLGARIAVAITAIGVALVVAGLAKSVVLVAAMYALGSFGIVVWNVQAVSVRQRLVPRELRGRVSSAYRLIGWGGIPVGAALGGVLGTAAGVRAPIVAGGCLALASLVLVPRLAKLVRA